MILAELTHILRPRKSPTHLSQTPSYALALFGLYLCSYPDSFAHQTPWSRSLLHLGFKIFPEHAMLGRFWPGLGAQLLCLAILTSPTLRSALSHRWCVWLGSISYALYLLHGTFIRTIMTYLVFGPVYLSSSPSARVVQPDLSPDPLVAQPSAPILLLEVALFSAILLGGVQLWSVRVEPYFAKATGRFDGFARTWGAGYRRWSGGGGLAAGGSWSRGRAREIGSVLPIAARRD